MPRARRRAAACTALRQKDVTGQPINVPPPGTTTEQDNGLLGQLLVFAPGEVAGRGPDDVVGHGAVELHVFAR